MTVAQPFSSTRSPRPFPNSAPTQRPAPAPIRWGRLSNRSLEGRVIRRSRARLSCAEAQKSPCISPLLATLTHSLSRKSFACHSYANNRDRRVAPPKFSLRFDTPSRTLTPFRINTCESVSKQTTLTSFRINTCEKPGGGGPTSPQPPARLSDASTQDLESAATMNFMNTKWLGLALLCLLPVAAVAQTADEILAKVIAARGGLAKIRSVRSERVSGQITFGEVSGPFLVELQRPLKMHMQFTIQNTTMVRVYDGKSAGWANNPFAGKMNPDPMSEEELKNISEESDFDGPLVDHKAKGNQVELVGKDKVKDKDVWRLKMTTKNGDVRFYLFDADSFLLVKWEGKRKADGQEEPVEAYLS